VHVSDRSNDSQGGATRSVAQKMKRTVQSKVLVPLAAAAVSTGVTYLAKKLPLILEEKVLPKLKEKGAPEQVTNVVEQTAETLGGFGESAPDEGGGSESGESTEADDQSSTSLSNDEREQERRQREERRRERKRSLSAA
jgi:hypothetical protein